MKSLVSALVVSVLACGVGGCRRGAAGASAARDAGSAEALVEQGRFDEAIARVGGGTDPDSLYWLGRAWIGKSKAAPLPTPVPGALAPAEGLFKPEELTAVGFLERAATARPDHAGTQLALAELLAPHALARVAAERERKHAGGLPPATGPDASPERVLHCYADAMQADPAGTAAAEALIRFAVAAGRLVEADTAFQELLRRKREDPDLLVRYGDFLAGPRGTPEAALPQYAQALIWRPTDAATRAKIVDIHLRSAETSLSAQEYVGADARIAEAKRVGIEPGSPQAQKLQQLQAALAEVRRR